MPAKPPLAASAGEPATPAAGSPPVLMAAVREARQQVMRDILARPWFPLFRMPPAERTARTALWTELGRLTEALAELREQAVTEPTHP